MLRRSTWNERLATAVMSDLFDRVGRDALAAGKSRMIPPQDVVAAVVDAFNQYNLLKD